MKVLVITMTVCLVTVEEPSSPSDGSDNEMESDEGSDRLAASSAADYVCTHCKSTSTDALLYLHAYIIQRSYMLVILLDFKFFARFIRGLVFVCVYCVFSRPMWVWKPICFLA